MARVVKIAAAVSLCVTVLLIILYRHTQIDWLLPVVITCATTAYHVCMRLAVGGFYQMLLGNRADYRRWWYQPHRGEEKVYAALGVKRWKRYMPTYAPLMFSPRYHSWDEIAQAMCQSELVHETCAVFSFVPLVAAIWFGAFGVFLATSFLAALLDIALVMVQRYNRPRIVRLAMKKQKG